MYTVTPKKLRFIRVLSGLSQQKFGEIIGAGNRSVSAWEVGKSKPNEDSVQKIVDYVGEDNFKLLDALTYAMPMQKLADELKAKANERAADNKGRL